MGVSEQARAPAFLVYYGPALLQLNNKTAVDLCAAVRVLSAVYIAARALFPQTDDEGQIVKVEIAELKKKSIDSILETDEGKSWVIVQQNDQEAKVVCEE